MITKIIHINRIEIQPNISGQKIISWQ